MTIKNVSKSSLKRQVYKLCENDTHEEYSISVRRSSTVYATDSVERQVKMILYVRELGKDKELNPDSRSSRSILMFWIIAQVVMKRIMRKVVNELYRRADEANG
jgi:hypothetical protein